jgi:hypothetical protein
MEIWDKMINVACIEKAWFKEVLDGTKTKQYGIRKRKDSRLENIRIGELLYLCEKGSQRVALCRILYYCD